MTLAEALHQIAVHPDAQPTPEAVEVLRDAMRRHPYFALPAALLLRTGHIDANEIAAVRARVAVLTADKEALASIAAEAGADPARFYPPEPVATPVSTESAIDTFHDTYGSTSPEEEALLERLIFNPVPDYADILAAETPLPDAATDAQDELIDAFLKKENGTAPAAPTLPEQRETAEAAATPAPDTSLSESLARIFIGQGRYAQALEIITDLAERSPEKNPFYADQARFLRKLMKING